MGFPVSSEGGKDPPDAGTLQHIRRIRGHVACSETCVNLRGLYGLPRGPHKGFYQWVGLGVPSRGLSHKPLVEA